MTAEEADEYDIAVPPANPFSIDGDDDEEGALLAAADANDELEGNYSDGDDASVDDDEEGHANTVNLASRTNMLMKDFNEYLTDITGEGKQDDANGNNNNTAAPTSLYRDFIDVEENNVDNPSTYEDVERELKMQGRYPKQTLRRSKRVKRGIGMIVIAAIIIGVSVGISTSKKNQRLPDWNQELEEQIEQEGITGDGLPGAKPEFSGQMGYEDSYNTFSQTTNTNTNTQPIAQFNTESSSGSHHAGSSNGNHHVGIGPYNHNVEVTNQPQEHHDNAHQILDGVTHSSSPGSALQEVYQYAQTRYKPVWFDRSTWTGTTYQEAQEFCASRDPSMDICPYEAVCPLGPSGHPNGGTKNEAFGSWVPLNNDANTWVQVGPEDPCLLYSYSHGHVPEWGLIQGGNEQQTRHIMCCQVDDTAKDSAVDRNPNLPNSVASDQQQQQQQQQQEESAYYSTEQTNVKPDVAAEEYLAAEEWDPTWYSRSNGWTGQTYEEASNFCKSLGDTSDLCYYSVICPTGPNHLPYGGEIVEAGGSWAPIKDSNNGWVQVGRDNVCIRYMTLNLDSPTWGITGEGNEEITRHLPCCTPPSLPTYSPTKFDDDVVSPEVPLPSNNEQADQPTSVADAGALAIMESIYKPVLYNRQSGWDGTNYAESIIFCASQGSRIPCYYEIYCPNGENADPYGGVIDDPNGAWAPIFDSPNGWVQIGKVGTCQKYNDIHAHPPSWGLGLGTGSDNEKFTRSLLCCEEPIKPEPEPSLVKPYSPLSDKEEAVLNNLRPIWFDQSHGYRGTTHEEAELFCNAVIGMHLCPIEAYCPNGPTPDNRPLFLQKETFQGEQWAPFNSLSGTQSDLGNQYVMIGTLDGDPSSTCMPYDSLHTNPLPPWSSDGSKTELKQHVMCCEQAETIQQQSVISKGVIPVWLDNKHGWDGGSYQDAEQFCTDLGGKKLCPYAVYCPGGIGRQPLGGHGNDFNSEGVQYAPIFGVSNEWVMIGQKDGNAATTCMLHSQLESGEPDWGLNDERQDLKNHILCCTF